MGPGEAEPSGLEQEWRVPDHPPCVFIQSVSKHLFLGAHRVPAPFLGEETRPRSLS